MGRYAGQHIYGDACIASQSFLDSGCTRFGFQVRGNGEMYPLNGPSWSLFFEYIGNILYALFIRRFSTKQLTVLVILAAIGLASFAVCNLSGYGHLGVGWSLLDYNLLGGFLRLLFAFSAIVYPLSDPGLSFCMIQNLICKLWHSADSITGKEKIYTDF